MRLYEYAIGIAALAIKVCMLDCIDNASLVAYAVLQDFHPYSVFAG
jgi:hypothetical protein